MVIEEDNKEQLNKEEKNKILEAKSLIKNEDAQPKNEENTFLSDPKFIKEILGDLKMDDNDKNIEEIMNWEKKDQDKDKKDPKIKEDKKD